MSGIWPDAQPCHGWVNPIADVKNTKSSTWFLPSHRSSYIIISVTQKVVKHVVIVVRVNPIYFSAIFDYNAHCNLRALWTL